MAIPSSSRALALPSADRLQLFAFPRRQGRQPLGADLGQQPVEDYLFGISERS